MRDALERGDWDEAGRLMREDWVSRRKNVPGITTPLIDKLIRPRGAPEAPAQRSAERAAAAASCFWWNRKQRKE